MSLMSKCLCWGKKNFFFPVCAAGTAALGPDPAPTEAEPNPEPAVFTAARSWQGVKRRPADLRTCFPFIVCCHWDWDYIGFHELAQHPGWPSTKLKLSHRGRG